MGEVQATAPTLGIEVTGRAEDITPALEALKG
jgi:hypothetical protein